MSVTSDSARLLTRLETFLGNWDRTEDGDRIRIGAIRNRLRERFDASVNADFDGLCDPQTVRYNVQNTLIEALLNHEEGIAGKIKARDVPDLVQQFLEERKAEDWKGWKSNNIALGDPIPYTGPEPDPVHETDTDSERPLAPSFADHQPKQRKGLNPVLLIAGVLGILLISGIIGMQIYKQVPAKPKVVDASVPVVETPALTTESTIAGRNSVAVTSDDGKAQASANAEINLPPDLATKTDVKTSAEAVTSAVNKELAELRKEVAQLQAAQKAAPPTGGVRRSTRRVPDPNKIVVRVYDMTKKRVIQTEHPKP